MKKIISFILLAALMLACFSGCQEQKEAYIPTGDALQQDNGPTVTVPTQPPEPMEIALVYRPGKSLNPFEASDHNNRVLMGLMYQGLFAVNRENEAMPILCDIYNVSPDMKTYTFHLASALFSDGTAVTAPDVVASLQASQTGWYAGRLQQVKSIEAFGNTVIIELLTPMDNLPVLLDIPVVKASQVAAANPLGSGPYKLDMASQTLQRQHAWWCDVDIPVETDSIRLVQAQSATDMRDAFEFSGVSLVCTDPSNAAQVDFRGDYELWEADNGHFLFLACNAQSEVFSVPEIRRALTHAIDRDTITESYYRGFARATQLPCDPGSDWYNRNLASNYGYDPEVFASAVAAASATLKSKEITLLCNSSDVTRLRVCTAIADMLREGGLTVKLVTVPTAEFQDMVKKGQYDLYLGQTRLSRNMDLSAFFNTTGSMNYGGMADPALYAMCLEAMANEGNYYNLHEAVMNKGQLCPILFQSYAIYTARGAFPTLDPARDNIFYYDLGRTAQDAQA